MENLVTLHGVQYYYRIYSYCY